MALVQRWSGQVSFTLITGLKHQRRVRAIIEIFGDVFNKRYKSLFHEGHYSFSSLQARLVYEFGAKNLRT